MIVLFSLAADSALDAEDVADEVVDIVEEAEEAIERETKHSISPVNVNGYCSLFNIPSGD